MTLFQNFVSNFAMTFPGQGSQTVGMGKSIADEYREAQAIFDEVDEALGENLSSIIWDGPAESLTLTSNAQPALMAVSLAVLRAMETKGVKVSDAKFVAGHSLGEYSALSVWCNFSCRYRKTFAHSRQCDAAGGSCWNWGNGSYHRA